MRLLLRAELGVHEVAGAVNDALHADCFVEDTKQDEIVPRAPPSEAQRLDHPEPEKRRAAARFCGIAVVSREQTKWRAQGCHVRCSRQCLPGLARLSER